METIKKNKLLSTFLSGKKVKLLRGGTTYFDLLVQLINEAKESIHLQAYIFEADETGEKVSSALMAAAKRGVNVYLLADGYASQQLPRNFIDELIAAGVHFRFFEPLLKSRNFYFGRRLHHKVFVADTMHCIVGGVNISDRYNDMPGKPAWLDFALYAEGEIAQQLCVLCWKTWKAFPVKMGITECEKKKPVFLFDDNATFSIRMRRNDWVRRKNEISATYIGMFRNAKFSIVIFCSYFLPGKIIRRLLSAAAARGVAIKVVTAGPSDVMVSKHAERWLYDWLLRHKIDLYEYGPIVLHAKIAVCDGEWFTVGSYNINNISAYASVELNLDVSNAVLAADVQQHLAKIIIHDCTQITMEMHLKTKNILKQFVRWFSYQFIRSVFYLFTFYFKRSR